MPPPPGQSPRLDQSAAPAIDQSLPDPLPADPFPLFQSWLADAAGRAVQPNPNAFSLATIDADGTPAARIVLCKGVDPASGHIVFYTNYDGRKGRALAANPVAAACFHWDLLDRQVRIEGPVTRSPAAESDAYFASRPWLSRVGAWTSHQSEPIASRAALAAQLDDTLRRFGIDPVAPPGADAEINIPRPPNWGGFRIWARRVELWVGGSGRLHDRAAWTRGLVAAADRAGFVPDAAGWSATRLQP